MPQIDGWDADDAFAGGMLERVTINVEQFQKKRLGDLFSLADWRRLRMRGTNRQFPSEVNTGIITVVPSLEDLLQAPQFANLTELDLSGYANNGCLREVDAQALAEEVHLANLTHLNLSGSPLGTLGVEAIASATHLAKLTHLDLSGNHIRNNEARVLARATHLANLTSLNLEHNHIGANGARALLEAAHLTNLTFLNLAHNNIGHPVEDLLRRRWPNVVL